MNFFSLKYIFLLLITWLIVLIGCNYSDNNTTQTLEKQKQVAPIKLLVIDTSIGNDGYYLQLQRYLHLTDKEVKAVQFLMEQYEDRLAKLKQNKSEDYSIKEEELKERTIENMKTVIGKLRLKKKATFDRYYKIDTAKMNKQKR